MTEIILWSLLAFFSAFGIVEFIRFLYADWCCTENNSHIVIFADDYENNIEIAVRNVLLSTDAKELVVIIDNPSADDLEIYEKLSKKYSYIKLMETEEYIEFIKNREC